MIRKAQAADADTVFDLLTQFAVSYTPERAAFDRNYPRMLDSQSVSLLVAEKEGQVIGYILAFAFLTLYANGLIVEIQELMVAPEARGQGIGRSLVEAVGDWARTLGAIEVTVPTRRAGDFYRRLGFAETAAYFKRSLEP